MASTGSSPTGPTSRANCSKRAGSAGGSDAVHGKATPERDEMVAAVPGRRNPREKLLGRLSRSGGRTEARPPQPQRRGHAFRRQPVRHDRPVLHDHAAAQPRGRLPGLGQVGFHRVRGARPRHRACAIPADRRAARRNQDAGDGGRKGAAGIRDRRAGREGRYRGQGPENPLRASQTKASADMNWPYPRIVAHRGGGALAPENTLGAMRLGASMGFKGVEFDVMLEKDGLPVIIHDETLERTTNGRGRVPDMSYRDLARFDAGKGNRIPKYEEAARLCLELGLWANVEIKPAKGYERPTGEARSRLTKELWKGAPLGPLLSSFSIEALEAARTAAPDLPRGYLVDKIPAGWRDTMQRLGCVA